MCTGPREGVRAPAKIFFFSPGAHTPRPRDPATPRPEIEFAVHVPCIKHARGLEGDGDSQNRDMRPHTASLAVHVPCMVYARPLPTSAQSRGQSPRDFWRSVQKCAPAPGKGCGLRQKNSFFLQEPATPRPHDPATPRPEIEFCRPRAVQGLCTSSAHANSQSLKHVANLARWSANVCKGLGFVGKRALRRTAAVRSARSRLESASDVRAENMMPSEMVEATSSAPSDGACDVWRGLRGSAHGPPAPRARSPSALADGGVVDGGFDTRSSGGDGRDGRGPERGVGSDAGGPSVRSPGRRPPGPRTPPARPRGEGGLPYDSAATDRALGDTSANERRCDSTSGSVASESTVMVAAQSKRPTSEGTSPPPKLQRTAGDHASGDSSSESGSDDGPFMSDEMRLLLPADVVSGTRSGQSKALEEWLGSGGSVDALNPTALADDGDGMAPAALKVFLDGGLGARRSDLRSDAPSGALPGVGMPQSTGLGTASLRLALSEVGAGLRVQSAAGLGTRACISIRSAPAEADPVILIDGDPRRARLRIDRLGQEIWAVLPGDRRDLRPASGMKQRQW